MKREISSDSAQWAILDHQVQAITGKSSVKVINAYKFDEGAALGEPFIMKNGREKTWIDATINITDFSKEYYHQVLQKRIPLQDLILYGGHVNIHKYASQPYKIFTFLLCKVCLGTAGTPTTPKVQNCDSIMIPPQNQQAFQYNFFVKQHSQYQVKYQVSFTLSEQKEFKLNELTCCNCQNRVPVIYCLTEKLNFCDQCCSDHHKPKLMYSHQLEPIDRINTLENCKNHNQKYQLYCLKCEKYLCALCIQKGVHAQGTDHVIKPIRYLYEELVENIENLPKKTLDKIEVLQSNILVKRKEIEDNQKEVRLEIQQEYKKNLKMLEEASSVKYQLLDSIGLELAMLKDKISWDQSFCVFQSTALKPIHFFKSQYFFETEMRKLRVGDYDTMLSCKADLMFKSLSLVGTREAIQRNKDFKKYGQAYMLKDQSQSRISKAPTENNLKISKEPIVIPSPAIFAFDPYAAPPSKDDLLSELKNCRLEFFEFKAK